MRDNNPLSPHRARRRDGRTHDGAIITDAPNVLWGTDGVRVFTLEDGGGGTAVMEILSLEGEMKTIHDKAAAYHLLGCEAQVAAAFNEIVATGQ